MLFGRRFPVGLFHDRGQQETHWYRAGIHLVFVVERQQDAGLQKAQTPLEIDVKGGREGIPLVERRGNAFPSLLQTRVIERHGHESARAVDQSRGQQRIKESLLLPFTAGLQAVLGAPVLLVQA